VGEKCQISATIITAAGKKSPLENTDILVDFHPGHGTIFSVERFVIDDPRYKAAESYRQYIEIWVARAMVRYYEQHSSSRCPVQEIQIADSSIPYREGKQTARKRIAEAMGGLFPYTKTCGGKFYFKGPGGTSHC
jgi:hypothetical protein